MTHSPSKKLSPASAEVFDRGKTFFQRFSDQRIPRLLEHQQKPGAPVYRAKDVLNVTHPLARLIRMLFIDQKITEPYLENLHRLYCISNGCELEKISSNKGNLTKALRRPDLTFFNFEKTLMILGATIVDMAVTLRLEDGRLVTYKYNDALQMQDRPLPTEGTPIFKPIDILATKHQIARFIRMFLVDQQVTVEQFHWDYHYPYYADQGYPVNWISSNRNNSYKRYFKSNPMFGAWEKFNAVMRVSMVDLSCTIRHRNGAVVTYALSDAEKYARLASLEDASPDGNG